MTRYQRIVHPPVSQQHPRDWAVGAKYVGVIRDFHPRTSAAGTRYVFCNIITLETDLELGLPITPDHARHLQACGIEPDIVISALCHHITQDGWPSFHIVPVIKASTAEPVASHTD